MTQAKVVLLAIISTLIVFTAECSFHLKQSDDVNGLKEMSLGFNDETLILNQSVLTQGAQIDGSVPADFTPLFFLKIPINEASAQLLQTIPGVGPKTAEQILQLRQKKSRIKEIDELLLIRGVGVKKQKILGQYLSFE